MAVEWRSLTFCDKFEALGLYGYSAVGACIVADPACLSRIPNPIFFRPGSWIRIRIKEFYYSNQKKFSKLSEI
jgi:hypothetical protein